MTQTDSLSATTLRHRLRHREVFVRGVVDKNNPTLVRMLALGANDAGTHAGAVSFNGHVTSITALRLGSHSPLITGFPFGLVDDTVLESLGRIVEELQECHEKWGLPDAVVWAGCSPHGTATRSDPSAKLPLQHLTAMCVGLTIKSTLVRDWLSSDLNWRPIVSAMLQQLQGNLVNANMPTQLDYWHLAERALPGPLKPLKLPSRLCSTPHFQNAIVPSNTGG